MAYHHRVTLGPAVLEYQLGGILRIAQWQGDVVYLLLVVDDDGVGAVCCHGERVERVVLHILGFGVYSIKDEKVSEKKANAEKKEKTSEKKANLEKKKTAPEKKVEKKNKKESTKIK